ncbi:DUF4870 domain-containing protein [Sungkyunkwania multivorans]|uniref:DUF4870 domain-containing protein n=1 Tax=Sungkyunkwania multivorans TaxID=1173618 RepID=A0ABW3CWE2_9FLAO
MDSSINQHQKNLATVVHVSTFSKYFIPFGNFIIPLILWTTNRDKSEYVDYHGKQAINFQVSILLYSVALGFIAIPLFLIFAWDFVGFVDIMDHNRHHVDFDFHHFNGYGGSFIFLGIFAMISLALLALDIFCTISAAIKANNGEYYKYPFTINFLK